MTRNLLLLKRVLKITLFQVLWSVLIVVLILCVCTWIPGQNSSTSEEPTGTPKILLWNEESPRAGSSKTKIGIPVISWWTKRFIGPSGTQICPNNIECHILNGRYNISKHFNVQAYLFYGTSIDFDDLPLPRRPKDIIWGLFHEESPLNNIELMHEPVLKLFNFSSTYSRYSDVPYSLQYLTSLDDITTRQYFVETSVKNSHLRDIAPILYLQSDCETSTERDLYVKELMRIAHIDSYGSCLNNKQLPEKFTRGYMNNQNELDFMNFVARYKFVIAIENGVCDDYVTEKFWRAIKVGTVPIYFGSPLIRDWLPNHKSAILLEDFPTPAILNDHLNKLLSNDVFYEEYLEHKTKRIVRNSRLIEEFNERSYQANFVLTVEEFECFVCKKVHDKMNDSSKVNIVSKSHYSCPKPISALQLDVNPMNNWVHIWEDAKTKSDEIYKRVMNKL